MSLPGNLSADIGPEFLQDVRGHIDADLQAELLCRTAGAPVVLVIGV